jgi:hypothetical protein
MRLLTLLLALPLTVFAQTGILEDFNDNTLDPGWKRVNPENFVLTETSEVLKVEGINAGVGWTNIEFSFKSQNISLNPVVKLKIKNAAAFNLRIDVIDDQGRANGTSVSQSIPVNSNYTNYTFNYSSRFGSANSAKISKVVIFLNGGGPAFNGTVYFDDLTIGDALPYFSSGPIRINQVGYELNGPKTAILERSANDINATAFNLINDQNQIVFTGDLKNVGQVAGWTGRYFWTADFSSFKTPGKYRVKIGSMVSYEFNIQENLLFTATSSSIVDFFKAMRHTGTGDKTLSFNGPRNDVVNVYGGWWDATGDPGKHISHLSYANHFNPQQIPMVVWALLKSHSNDQTAFTAKSADLIAEAAWGADYLLRNLDREGYFYISVFDDWGNAPSSREICEWGQPDFNNARTANYQCAFREGAGMAIAALARASYMKVKGDSTSQQYLNGAVRAYAHMKSPGTGYATKNLQYDNDHKENIIDDYCALLAATELNKATGNAEYAADARLRAERLLAKLNPQGWWASDDAGNRPFFHAADEGLPIVALLEFSQTDNSKNGQILEAIRKNINWYIAISQEVNNPYSYLRLYAKGYEDGALLPAKKAFFLPHNNETTYWWQGENARLASMSAALLMAARQLNPGFEFGSDSISRFAVSQLDWILGKNPFEICHVYGFGYKNYPSYPTSNGKPNIIGGICNGITSKDLEETNISWMPYAASSWENWRWIEQWLPHDAWYLLAVSAVSHLNNTEGSAITQFGPVTAQISGDGVGISWTTDFELNGKQFQILKSSNGIDFTEAGIVNPEGSASQGASYTFKDISGGNSKIFYKIVFTDLNGLTLESETESIIISAATEYKNSFNQVYPNPFSQKAYIVQDKDAVINVTDLSGKLFETSDYTRFEYKEIGQNLPAGIYLIEIISGDQRRIEKIVKLKD